MERTMSVEEKIRRAEEIYARRQGENIKNTTTVNINAQNKKDIKLLKKMIIQIIISLIIYFAIYIIQNNNYIFSEDVLKNINGILSYDIEFEQIYENLKDIIEKNINNMKNNESNGIIYNEIENAIEENGIGNTVNEAVNEHTISEEIKIENELSQEEKDILEIKSTTSFIKPVNGWISSKFGEREPTTIGVPKNHTGVDIAANLGTKIISSTEGEVVLVSGEGDYGKHLKIQIGEVSIIYAHCNKIYAKQNDKIMQGQEIAEVGSTGNSTGPHLHFEIRVHERVIDPEKILEL